MSVDPVFVDPVFVDPLYAIPAVVEIDPAEFDAAGSGYPPPSARSAQSRPAGASSPSSQLLGAAAIRVREADRQLSEFVQVKLADRGEPTPLDAQASARYAELISASHLARADFAEALLTEAARPARPARPAGSHHRSARRR
jgi:hypothetical protein